MKVICSDLSFENGPFLGQLGWKIEGSHPLKDDEISNFTEMSRMGSGVVRKVNKLGLYGTWRYFFLQNLQKSLIFVHFPYIFYS